MENIFGQLKGKKMYNNTTATHRPPLSTSAPTTATMAPLNSEDEYKLYVKSLMYQAEQVPALQKRIDQSIPLAKYVKAANWLIDEANVCIHNDQFNRLFIILTQLANFFVNVITKHIYYDQNADERPIVELRHQCSKALDQLEALKDYFRKCIVLKWEQRRRMENNQPPIDTNKEQNAFLEELKAKLRQRGNFVE